MNYTINEIPDEAVELSGNEMIPIWQGETKKVSVATLASSVIPVGAVMPFANGTTSEYWLLCDGRDTTGTAEELRTHYPALYTYLGNSNVLPDYRECVLVGVGQNDTDTISAHDVYTLGEFKDDQLQNITGAVSFHDLLGRTLSVSVVAGALKSAGRTGINMQAETGASSNDTGLAFDASLVARTGTTTHGKQKGVAYYIKAK